MKELPLLSDRKVSFARLNEKKHERVRRSRLQDGYPADFLFRHQRGVEASTAADIQRVAQTYLKPEKLVTLVVGNAATIQPPLTHLAAEVTPVDITIPGSKQSS